MGITHVIRGDDHVNNTPRQINILRALGARAAASTRHVPMILGPDGDKLSKRHGAVSVLQYRDGGYLPEAMLNYLARLGWSHGDDELFSRAAARAVVRRRAPEQERRAVGRGQAALGQRALHQAGRRCAPGRPAAADRSLRAGSTSRPTACRRCARCSRTAARPSSNSPTGWACTSPTSARRPPTWRRMCPMPLHPALVGAARAPGRSGLGQGRALPAR